jgi:hypothetical protein
MALSPTVTALAAASPLRQALKKYPNPGSGLSDGGMDYSTQMNTILQVALFGWYSSQIYGSYISSRLRGLN